MRRTAVALLKVLLVVGFLGVLLVQSVLLPDEAARMARSAPEFAHLRFPVLTMAIVGLVSVQVVLACIWRLLTYVSRDRVFSRGAFRWVDVIIGSGAVAAVLAVALVIYLVAAGAGQPGVILFLFFAAVMAGGVALLLYVLRLLLAKAVVLDVETQVLHAELDEVV